MRGIEKARWREISPLLDELFELEAAQAEARLAQVRADDAELAATLERLLAERNEVERDGFLEGSAVDLAAIEVPSLEGTTLGAWTLERPLGHGGMGTVWLARRSDGRFEGRAAIKFLNLALLARGGAERFRREGNLLARLAHPNIARLLDAGVAAGGQPYLVLEYVDGEPIDRWCEARALGVRERLKLFLAVLAAVAHAHSNLILHRDLKPSNILVTGDGHVKLLDFGIGKLLEDQQPTVESALTQLAGRAFTPEYTSPEQVLGGEVTTAADVYSLGIVLYELLAGTRPYKPKRASAAAVEEAIAEQDVPPASTVATRPEARRALRGDLDAILAQALRKNPSQRYATVSDLAADIERYLDGLPVHAQPDRFGYRLAKFVRRNALAVAASAAVLLAVLVGSAVAVWQAHEATRQRDRALALAGRNTAVLDFVRTMLVEAAPADEPIRVGELLDRSVSLLSAGGGQPEHEAAVLGMLATYFATGPSQPAKASALLERSLELTASTRDFALRGSLMCDSAYVLARLGQSEKAMRLIDEGIALAGDDDMAATTCFNQRAGISRMSNDPAGALKYAQLAHQRLLASGMARPAEEASVLDMIAAAHMQAGRHAEAERHSAAALAKLAEAGRGQSPVAGAIRQNRAVFNHAVGDYRRALENYDEALRIAVKWGRNGEAPSYLLSNRAKALRDLGQYDEALAEFDRAFAIAKKNDEVAMQIDSLAHRALTFVEMGDITNAEKSLGDALALRAALPPASPTALAVLAAQGRVALARERAAEAAARFGDVIDALDRRKATTGALTTMLRGRAAARLQTGDVPGAEEDAMRALDVARRLQATAPWSSLAGMALMQLAHVQQARGDAAAAEKTMHDAADHLRATLGDAHPDTQRALRWTKR